MAEESVIKSFLVELGFKLDEPALKKLETGVTTATKAAAGLALAVEGMALAVAVGIARFASGLEALYFASQRTGASVANLKAFDLAAQDFGAQAGEATASIEGLAHAMRVNPGNQNYLSGLLAEVGQSAYGANGHLRDTTDLMEGLAKVFQINPIYIDEQYAQMFGISEHTMLAMRNGSFTADLEKKRKQYASGGFDKAAADAHQFQSQLRDLKAQLNTFGTQVGEALQKKLGGNLKQLNDWLAVHGPAMANTFASAASIMINAAKQLSSWLGTAFTGMVKMDEKAGDLLQKLIPQKWDDKIGAFVAATLAQLGVKGAQDAIDAHLTAIAHGRPIEQDGHTQTAGARTGTATRARSWGDALEHFLGLDSDKLRQQLARTEMGQSGFGEAAQSGILSNLEAEDPGLDPNKPGDHGAAWGIAQWHKPFWDLFKKWSGGLDIHNSSFAQQMSFLLWDLDKGPDAHTGALLKAAQNAEGASRDMTMRYERPRDRLAQADKRATAAVNIDAKQTTNITMHGTDDATRNAKAIADQQRKVNADLVRNLASVQ